MEIAFGAVVLALTGLAALAFKYPDRHRWLIGATGFEAVTIGASACAFWIGLQLGIGQTPEHVEPLSTGALWVAGLAAGYIVAALVLRRIKGDGVE